MKSGVLDEEVLFQNTVNEMLERIPERFRKADRWPVRITAKFFGKEESAVRRMISEGRLFTFKNGGVHEVHVASVMAYLRRQNGFDE